MNHKNIVFIITLLFSFIYSKSIWVNYGWEIFDNAGDGRALSLGNSFIADGTSPISVLWNPAHQDSQRILPFSYGHQNRFAGLVSSDVLVFGLKNRFKTPLSIVILREAVSSIPDTRDLLLDWGEDGMPGTLDTGEGNGILDEGERLDIENVKYFNQSQWGIHLSTAKNINKFSVGIAIKSLFHNLGGYKGNGFGFDIGAKFSPWQDNIVGLTFNHFTTSWFIWDNGTVERTMPNISLGVTQLFKFAKLPLNFRINGGFIKTLSYKDFQFNIGAEINYKSNLQIRLGRNNNGFLSTGIGLVWTNFSIDYAYRPSPSYTGFGSSQLISFRIDPVWFKTKIVSFL
ncbi:MAG: hypothetical protein CMG37_03680 [Candidatus Marinimicrobia bacterium]|nr:hypothetical protein [Candidatus Neomarinimicrobiota bacterium]